MGSGSNLPRRLGVDIVEASDEMMLAYPRQVGAQVIVNEADRGTWPARLLPHMGICAVSLSNPARHSRWLIWLTLPVSVCHRCLK